ncbi:MAG: sulfatase-like hydrolase/transferase, partial [Akkermansiaceae bacterium]|nr:sulfatase-like hydrolase/transferase [Akkermansiaceae bacterium]
PLRGMKRDLTEGGIRVPTIAWWPGTVSAGGEDDAPWYFGDLMATAAELAGVKVPDGIDSDSFAGPLRGQPREKRPERTSLLYWEFHERGSAQAVRFGKWKAIRKPMVTGPVELYNLSNDPGEKHDHAGSRPDLARHAAALMDEAHEPDANWPVPGAIRTPGKQPGRRKNDGVAGRWHDRSGGARRRTDRPSLTSSSRPAKAPTPSRCAIS